MFENVRHFAFSQATRVGRHWAKGAATSFMNGTAASNIVGHLRSDEFRPQEPADKKSSEWLLWHMIENRKEMIAQLIESLEGEREISGEVVKAKARPLLARVIESEAQPEIVEAINGVSDNIAQAVLRLLVEINHVAGELAESQSGETKNAGARPPSALAAARERGLLGRLKTATGNRMHHVVPDESQSEVIKKAGKLAVRALAECGVGL